MNSILRRTPTRRLAAVAAIVLLAGCVDADPLAVDVAAAPAASFARSLPSQAAAGDAAVLATLRRVTARYHDLEVAIADGFELLHPCENRPDEGPVGLVYYHPVRLMDGVVDAELPDALVYEPSKKGRPKLVAVEFAVPYALWNAAEPPTFLGHELHPEDEFGVYGIHVWVWRNNPAGMFAESNPRVTCDAD